MPPIPPITQFLMLACTAVFCIQQLASLAVLALFPLASGVFFPWQPFTYPFVHAGVFQLFFNMLALWMFGSELEMLWGRKRYMAFLLASGLGGALLYLLMTFAMRGAPMVGFSSVIYGLLMATALLFPDRTIMPLFPPIPMKMKVFAVVFAVILLLTSWNDVSALAQAGGALGGWLVIRYWRGQAPFGRRRR
jgi:membrane associated rhomboid family serine protease